MLDKLEQYRGLIFKRYDLLADISKLEKTREEYSPSILSSGIGGTRGSGTSAPTESIAIQELTFFEEINNDIAEKEKQLAEVTKDISEIEAFINSIQDAILQSFFIDKYKNGLSWSAIAIKWNYAPTSWIVIKKKVVEYVNHHESI